MKPRLSFLGAAGTVTGSCYLLEHDGGKLLVDCGLFQGSKSLKELNYRPFPFKPAEIGAVLLTHAHIDHSGLLPKLVKDGYGGRILATGPTQDLLTYMLPDSGYIQESEVDRLNRRLRQRGEEPVEAIYGKEDAERALDQIEPVPFDQWIKPMAGVRARYWNAGHILGAASIELQVDGDGPPVHLLFSGDIGTEARALHGEPQAPQGLDYLIVESTYGDRARAHVTAAERRRRLGDEVREALGRGRNLVIPVFAIERTQELLFDLGLLNREGVLGDLPIFLDSPLAVHATDVFRRHATELGEAGATRHPFDGPNIRFVETVENSKKINHITAGAIIMAASGMCEAGRIRHHLMANLWRPQSTVLMVGYQAPGTLGRLLLDGARAVRILGEEIRVRARIRELDIYSAHADQTELVDWIAARQPVKGAILLTHGEQAASAALAASLAGGPVRLPPILRPTLGSLLTLDPTVPAVLDRSFARIRGAELAEADWHNAQSRFLLDLAEVLRRAPTDQARTALLTRLRSELNEG
ncbi:MAG TPA: MBL fold metallo-hydrolase [Aliidongia sp.]|nr:MBL fold metallo-hydrolase [Aliidongia sp.]